MIAVGETAPDFSLEGTGGRRYTLAEHRGAPVVLAFYPADGSPVNWFVCLAPKGTAYKSVVVTK